MGSLRYGAAEVQTVTKGLREKQEFHEYGFLTWGQMQRDILTMESWVIAVMSQEMLLVHSFPNKRKPVPVYSFERHPSGLTFVFRCFELLSISRRSPFRQLHRASFITGVLWHLHAHARRFRLGLVRAWHARPWLVIWSRTDDMILDFGSKKYQKAFTAWNL